MIRDKTKECKSDNKDTQIINAITKWRLKARVTKERRTAYMRTVKKIQEKYLRACFVVI